MRSRRQLLRFDGGEVGRCHAVHAEVSGHVAIVVVVVVMVLIRRAGW